MLVTILLITSLILVSTILVILLKLLSSTISEKVTLNRQELSSYECGFETNNLSRIPFSLRYFFLTLIFLLFDLEIVLLLITPPMVLSTSSSLSIFLMLTFVIILFLGLIYEWNDGTLDWLN